MEQMKRRPARRRAKRILFVLLFFLFLLWIYVGNTRIQITELTYTSKKLPQAFDEFRIAHLSDVHNGQFGEKQNHLLEQLEKTRPDIIVITGDLIDSRRPSLSPAMELIEGAVKIAPVYYVTGNHEARTRVFTSLKKELEEAKVHLLDDSILPLTKDQASIHIMGLRDPEFFSLSSREETSWMFLSKLEEMKKESQDFTILLSHRPEHFATYVESGVDLVFSGHAHGGQFRIPFIGGLIAPHQGFFPKYTSGLYQEKNTTMVVSRGIGNSIILVRVNNPPEIILLELRKGE